MIEYQPALFSKEWYRTGTYLRTLPCTFRKGSNFHYTTVFSPIFHVRTVTDVNISKRCMTVIARTAQHSILTIYLLRKKYPVTVKRQKGIFALEEFFEVECIANTDSRSVVTITPGYPVTVFNPGDTRIVFILGLYHLRIPRFETDRLMAYFPIDSVFTKARKDIHLHCLIITTEDTGKSIPERNYRTIENTVGSRNVIASDNRVFRVTPHNVCTTFRAFFPRHIHHLFHNSSMLLVIYFIDSSFHPDR